MAIRTYQGIENWLSAEMRYRYQQKPRHPFLTIHKKPGHSNLAIHSNPWHPNLAIHSENNGIEFWLSTKKHWHSKLAIQKKTVATNKTLDYPLWLLQMNAYVSIFNHFCIRESIWSVSIQDFWTPHSSHPALQNPTKLFYIQYIMCSFYKVRLGGRRPQYQADIL